MLCCCSGSAKCSRQPSIGRSVLVRADNTRVVCVFWRDGAERHVPCRNVSSAEVYARKALAGGEVRGGMVTVVDRRGRIVMEVVREGLMVRARVISTVDV